MWTVGNEFLDELVVRWETAWPVGQTCTRGESFFSSMVNNPCVKAVSEAWDINSHAVILGTKITLHLRSMTRICHVNGWKWISRWAGCSVRDCLAGRSNMHSGRDWPKSLSPNKGFDLNGATKWFSGASAKALKQLYTTSAHEKITLNCRNFCGSRPR
jgi:hypothetical protein